MKAGPVLHELTYLSFGTHPRTHCPSRKSVALLAAKRLGATERRLGLNMLGVTERRLGLNRLGVTERRLSLVRLGST